MHIELDGSTTGLWCIIGGYLVVLLIVSIVARARRSPRINSKQTVEYHFLADRSIGSVVLIFTLYATTISGYSIFGFPGAVYRGGWIELRWITGAASSLLAFIVVGPRFYRLSKLHKFISPLDFIHQRYNSTAMSVLSALLMIVSLCLYVVAQCKAMGELVHGLSNGRIPQLVGAALLACLILLCELLGGLTIVCMTDLIQGVLMVSSVTFVVITVLFTFPEDVFTAHFVPVSLPTNRVTFTPTDAIETFGFYVLMFSWCANPMVIQRCFSAKSEASLKTGLIGSQLVTAIALFPLFVCACVAKHRYTLQPEQVDQTLIQLLKELLHQSVVHYWGVSLLLSGVIAAFMSTTDSCINCLSCIVSLDFIGRYLMPNNNGTQYKAQMQTAKVVACVVAVCAVLTAHFCANINLAPLMLLQLNITLQMVPTILFGLFRPNIVTADVLPPLLIALLILFFLPTSCNPLSGAGVDVGELAFVCNIVLVCVCSTIRQKWLVKVEQATHNDDDEPEVRTQKKPLHTVTSTCEPALVQVKDCPQFPSEPMSRNVGYPLLAIALSLVGLPWFATSEPAMVMSIPVWVWFMMATNICSVALLVCWGITCWQYCSKELLLVEGALPEGNLESGFANEQVELQL